MKSTMRLKKRLSKKDLKKMLPKGTALKIFRDPANQHRWVLETTYPTYTGSSLLDVALKHPRMRNTLLENATARYKGRMHHEASIR